MYLCNKNAHSQEALACFNEMQAKGSFTITIFSVIHVCKDLSDLEQGKRNHDYELRISIP